MKIRGRNDVRKEQKRVWQIRHPNGPWVKAVFCYERLGHLCFVCGLIGHSDRFYIYTRGKKKDEVPGGWGPDLRAGNRRQASTRIWLRDSSSDLDKPWMGGSVTSFGGESVVVHEDEEEGVEVGKDRKRRRSVSSSMQIDNNSRMKIVPMEVDGANKALI